MKYPGDFINKIICGDCLEVMKEMPDRCVDLVITSPPYNVGANIKRSEIGINSMTSKYINFDDNLSMENYYNWYQIIKSLF